jgi:hypothetical protein
MGLHDTVDAVINTFHQRMYDKWHTNSISIADKLAGTSLSLYTVENGVIGYNVSAFKNFLV